MKKLFSFFVLLITTKLVLAQYSTDSATSKIDTEKTVAWIKQNALPLKSVKAGNGFEDLVHLKVVLENVQIVGLGEATHGTKEFFQMKHRMIEFLVKEMGFTVIALELNSNGANNINKYILSGKGDIYYALASQGLLVWNTEEIINMIEWLRDYNQTVPDDRKVRFMGFDFRVNWVGDNFDVIKEYLKRVDLKSANQNDSLLNLVKKIDSGSIKGINTDSCKNEFLKFFANFSINKGDYVQHTSKNEYENILQRLAYITQNLCWNHISGYNARELYTEKVKLRDYYMSSNFMSFFQNEKPNTKFIVWAHNGHISKAGPSSENGNIKCFGNYLNEAYGKKYYAFGFSFDKGSFQSYGYSDERKPLGMMEFTVSAEHKKTLDWYLSQTGLNPFIINFRTNQIPDFMNEFLSAKLLARSPGAEVVQGLEERLNSFVEINKCYDALIFINNTSGATPFVYKQKP